MSFRIGALLCLTGLAACSNTNSEPPQEAHSYETTSTATNDPDMRPASLEDAEASTTPTNTPSNAPHHTTAAKDPAATGAPHTAAVADPSRSATTPASAPAPAPAGTQPDNTKVNERDTKSSALTPMDQGNNETDLKITQQIRQAVMAIDSLSFTAKNVKIITNGGKVTLRGPVKTDQERSAIEGAARKVAGAQVDNQIEVKK